MAFVANEIRGHLSLWTFISFCDLFDVGVEISLSYAWAVYFVEFFFLVPFKPEENQNLAK